ncbi:MAG: right-handed parallel beta-helix repeat-containing protein [Candidatus Eisenbacteria bacterium]|nr:right-handed parallel beta-helix repeat-containing protein [Candidatus Eisenbacteria bacterium]
MKKASTVLLFGLLLLAAAWPAGAATIFVPGSYNTIQKGINAARSGDIVQVGPGTYSENISLKAGVQLIGAGPEFTTIDGKGSYITVFVPYNATSSTRLEGFTVRNGSYQKGGGIYFQSGSTAVISNCHIRQNRASIRGGGIFVDNMASPTIEFCRITENTAHEGAGIYAQTSTPVIRWNVICGNQATSFGGGIHLAFCTGAVVEQNTIAYNSCAPGYGSGISLAGTSPALRNNIVAFNTGGPGVWAQNCTPSDLCSIVWGNPAGNYHGVVQGQGSVSADPLFCSPEGCDDLTVSGSSPAVSDPACGLIGALSIGCGETATENTSWGAVKSMYR